MTLPRLSRLLLVAAAAALAGAYVFPLWRIGLVAPQYPEGLGMLIRVHTITGVQPQDLANINELNHYIGMKQIVPDAIPELTVMPWVLAALIVGVLAAAATGRRWLLHVWLGAFAAFGAWGLFDFWEWERDYGHNLDPRAAISIPGMTYQPPLIGAKTLLNFVATSWPAAGGILLGVAFLLGVMALLVRPWHVAHRAATHAAAPVPPPVAPARS
ncbi:hypothetical protein J421_5032 (plasmid) [Gemmatirosa kalamazoonensis]|uniref:Cytochrome C n=1 Tax=Gemmatirosa kalamazoonensis TaxID=861299 RepID=W0RQ06_9BACT|nr:hypothetical protein [Gemmatirosa kalamazoonensis]AHG92567.1 hypothetical protein J421_5032 [Gemmatirosa kalamazoonensis]